MAQLPSGFSSIATGSSSGGGVGSGTVGSHVVSTATATGSGNLAYAPLGFASPLANFNFFGVQNVFNLGNPGRYDLTIKQQQEPVWCSFQEQQIVSSTGNASWMTPVFQEYQVAPGSADFMQNIQPNHVQLSPAQMPSKNRICVHCCFMCSDKPTYLRHLIDAHQDIVDLVQAIDLADNAFPRGAWVNNDSG